MGLVISEAMIISILGGITGLALGHWNRAIRVGHRDVPAYYSGSPDLSDSVNVVRLKTGGKVAVRRRRIVGGDGV